VKKIVIIDCNAICWSVFHALPPMSHGEKSTAIIYGFLNNLFEIQSRQNADHLVFAWDGKGSKREEIFPAYKEKRKNKYKEQSEEEKIIHRDRKKQFKEIQNSVLPGLGFNNVLQEDGFEGDDIIGSIVKDYEKTHFIIIVGRDNDLFQLIGPNCQIWDHGHRKFINEEIFFEKYGIYPDTWADVKAIAGCSSDEVPGVQNVGEGRAISYLLNQLKPTSKIRKRIENSSELIAFTRRLTTLPFEGTPHYRLNKDSCSVHKLKAVAKKYGLNSYLTEKRYQQFGRYFCEEEKSAKPENKPRVERPNKSFFNRRKRI
jgi:DNA polymerase-1